MLKKLPDHFKSAIKLEGGSTAIKKSFFFFLFCGFPNNYGKLQNKKGIFYGEHVKKFP